MTYLETLELRKREFEEEINRRGERLQNLFLDGEGKPLPQNSILINQEYEKQACAEDIYHWFKYVWIYEPRPVPQDLPFIPWKFQKMMIDDLLDCIRNGKDLRIEKSRDMGVTWTILLVFTYLWQFHKMTFLVGSRKAEEVDKFGDLDTLLPKIRYVLNRQPKWLLPRGFDMEEHASYMNIRNPETGGSITGESNNANFGTGGRKNAIFFDEFAKWEFTDALAWTSAFQNTPCRIAASTPLFRNNKFYELKENNEIGNLRLHWTDHPLHGIFEEAGGQKRYPWYEDQKKRASAEEIAQELDISYAGTQQSTVYHDEISSLKAEKRLAPIAFVPGLLLVWAMDPGMGDLWANGFYQVLGYSEEVRFIDYYENSNEKIQHYTDWVKDKERIWNKIRIEEEGGPNNYYSGWKDIIVVPDPNQAPNRELASGKSLVSQLRESGFRHVRIIHIGALEKISEAKRVFKNLWWNISPRCMKALEHAESYHYKFNQHLNEYDREPVHDKHSHWADQFGYFAAYLKNPEKMQRKMEMEKNKRDIILKPVVSHEEVPMAGA